MEITNKYGQVVKSGILANDILKDHLSTQALFEKRSLDFVTREDFLEQLSKVLSKNTKLFNNIKKTIEKNDKVAVQKQYTRVQQSANDKTKQIEKAKKSDATTPIDKLKEMEEEKTAIIAEISSEEQTLNAASSILEIRMNAVTETQRVFNEAKKALQTAKSEQKDAQKAVDTATSKLEKLNTLLSDIEQKIEAERNKTIYLVAPGYIGEIPSFGTFVSTAEIEGVSTKIEQIAPEFKIKPDFEDMLNAGYDSAQEYAKALQFVGLITQYIYNEKQYSVLVSDKRIEELLAVHIGG